VVMAATRRHRIQRMASYSMTSLGATLVQIHPVPKEARTSLAGQDGSAHFPARRISKRTGAWPFHYTATTGGLLRHGQHRVEVHLWVGST
jgi:hypothetical protein